MARQQAIRANGAIRRAAHVAAGINKGEGYVPISTAGEKGEESGSGHWPDRRADGAKKVMWKVRGVMARTADHLTT